MKKEDIIVDLLESQGKRLDSIDVNLAEHMRRTDLLEELNNKNSSRIDILEEPKKARAYLINTAISISKLSGAVLAVAAILKLIDKI